MLAPTLAPGDIVRLDNLACHRNAAARRAVEAAGASLLFLPPYRPTAPTSTDRERLLKTQYHAPQGRSTHQDQLWRAIAQIIDTFIPSECANYFATAVYDAD